MSLLIHLHSLKSLSLSHSLCIFTILQASLLFPSVILIFSQSLSFCFSVTFNLHCHVHSHSPSVTFTFHLILLLSPPLCPFVTFTVHQWPHSLLLSPWWMVWIRHLKKMFLLPFSITFILSQILSISQSLLFFSFTLPQSTHFHSLSEQTFISLLQSFPSFIVHLHSERPLLSISFRSVISILPQTLSHSLTYYSCSHSQLHCLL